MSTEPLTDVDLEAIERTARKSAEENPYAAHTWFAHTVLNMAVELRERRAVQETPAPRWQPIETAPKDGAPILVSGWPGQAHGVALVFWEEGFDEAGWLYDDFGQGPITEDGWEPTHWQPLPPAPVETQEGR